MAPGNRKPRLSWLGLMSLTIALACVLASTLIGTDQWTQWFAHPHRQPLPETTRQGAALWRIMLIASAGAVIIVPLALTRWCRPREVDPSHLAAMSARERWLLLGLVFVAFALRAIRLGESLWYDEIVALGSFAIHGPGAIIANYFDPANHVLHTLLTWVSMSLLERAIGLELALRVPSLVASLATVAACHGLARRAFGAPVPMLAALLAATLPVLVLEGVEARGYSMMILFSAISTWTLIEAMQDDRPLPWIGYALACSLGAWSHPMTMFMPLGHALWVTWMAIRDRRADRLGRFALASCLAASLALTLYAPAIPDLLRLRDIVAASASDQPTLLGIEGWHALLQLGGSWRWWAAWPGLIIALIGFVATVRGKLVRPRNDHNQDDEIESNTSTRRDVMALMWLGLPLFIIAVWVTGAWCYARFMLFAMPAAVVSIAIGIDALRRSRPWLGWLSIGIVVLASALDLATLSPKQPLRDAADLVRAHATTGESVLVIGLVHPVMDVYSEHLQLSYASPLGADLALRLDDPPNLNRPRWIILYYHATVPDSTFQLLRLQDYKQFARFHGWLDWGNGDVIVYRGDM